MEWRRDRQRTLRVGVACAMAAGCACGLGSLVAVVQSLFLAIAVTFLVLPITAGIFAGLAGLRSIPAIGLSILSLAAFVGGFALVESGNGNSGDGDGLPIVLQVIILMVPGLLIVASSMTAYVATRAFRSARRMAL